ncbi:uncharacterized protein LOC141649787 [Silene latifolia]|uniref:uncharacterized protein LOC141649787 n=1 Tax=Silene latifolia TaxID=37657 RepID=UPI003D78937C
MEKSEEAYSGQPPSRVAYLSIGRPDNLATIINEVGAGFSLGTFFGFFSYLAKDRQGVRRALAKSPRFGGMCSFFNLCAEVGLFAHYKLRGGTGPYKADVRHGEKQPTSDPFLKPLAGVREVLRESSNGRSKEVVREADIAILEAKVKLCEMLRDTLEQTRQHVQNKQAMRQGEQDEDEEDEAESDKKDGDDEKERNNPLKLPMGWDEKPIPTLSAI